MTSSSTFTWDMTIDVDRHGRLVASWNASPGHRARPTTTPSTSWAPPSVGSLQEDLRIHHTTETETVWG